MFQQILGSITVVLLQFYCTIQELYIFFLYLIKNQMIDNQFQQLLKGRRNPIGNQRYPQTKKFPISSFSRIPPTRLCSSRYNRIDRRRYVTFFPITIRPSVILLLLQKIPSLLYRLGKCQISPTPIYKGWMNRNVHTRMQ